MQFYQNSNGIFTEIGKNSKICMESQKTQITKVTLRKKNKAGSITFVDFKVYCEAIVIKKEVWYYQKTRHINQRNRIDSPERNPGSLFICGQ